MTLEDIKGLTPTEMVKELKKGRTTELPVIKDILKQIDVKKHSIFDEIYRPNKLIKLDDDKTKVENVARIGLAMQKLIVKRAVAFIFGNPVGYVSNNDKAKEAFKLFNEILKDVKIDSFNRKVARDLFSTTEVAELWYPVPVTDTSAKEKFKLKVKKLSVLTGDDLYPYFDEFRRYDSLFKRIQNRKRKIF